MKKEEWKAYYNLLLNSGLATIESLKNKYYSYLEHEDRWLKSLDRYSYLHAKAALKEICGIGETRYGISAKNKRCL